MPSACNADRRGYALIAPTRKGRNVENRKSIAAIIAAATLTAAVPAWADTRGDVLDGIQRCGVIHDDRTWLDCMYGAQQPMRAQLGLAPAPEFQQRLVPMAQPGIAQPSISQPPPRTVARPPKKPGFFASLVGVAPPFAVSRMASYRYEKNGAFVVALENGQEWRQTNVEAGSVSWMKQPSSYRVTISSGAFGSYNLRTDDAPQSYKVERIR
jgi:hypothetical protein